MANSYDRTKDPTGGRNANASGSARNWYALQASDLGAKELPNGYSRALRINIGSTATPPLTMVVVPIDEPDDSVTRTVIVSATEVLPYSVRRIVSLNGGATIPTGVSIDVITK